MVHRGEPGSNIAAYLMLPGKSGYDICKELREEGNNVPIIMITAKTEETDKERGWNPVLTIIFQSLLGSGR